jgi:hypothetical protein
MKAHFSEVLARERASLARVTSRAELACWRRRMVDELMTPGSPYVLALRPTGDMLDRADFLQSWRRLIAEAVARLGRPDASQSPRRSTERSQRCGVDAQEAAMLILAALQGGSTLSQVAQDPWPLNAALDLALGPFARRGGHGADDDEEIE